MTGGLKVLIVGGGIAGPSLAMWLGKLGCEVVVVERSPQGRHSGQQIDVRGYGVDVMKKSTYLAVIIGVMVFLLGVRGNLKSIR